MVFIKKLMIFRSSALFDSISAKAEEMMNEIERMVAIEEIKQLKARYFRCLDTKDWLGYQCLYTQDAVMNARESVSVRDHLAATLASISSKIV